MSEQLRNQGPLPPSVWDGICELCGERETEEPGFPECLRHEVIRLRARVAELERDPQRDPSELRHIVLELPPQKSAVRFRLTTYFPDQYANDEHMQFLYEEHSCPSNWLQHIDQISFEGDNDPHGLIKFVAILPPLPESEDDDQDRDPRVATVARGVLSR